VGAVYKVAIMTSSPFSFYVSASWPAPPRLSVWLIRFS
jgi:hypothetical protein